MFFEAGGDGSEVLELAEEALDEVPIAIEEGAERRLFAAPRAARLCRSASLS